MRTTSQLLDDDGHLMDIQSEDEQNVAANLTGKNVYVKVPSQTAGTLFVNLSFRQSVRQQRTHIWLSLLE